MTRGEDPVDLSGPLVLGKVSEVFLPFLRFLIIFCSVFTTEASWIKMDRLEPRWDHGSFLHTISRGMISTSDHGTGL